MDSEAIASRAYKNVPGTRLAGVLDMHTALFLAVEAGSCRPTEADELAVSAREIFDGAIAQGLRHSFVPSPGKQRVDEVIVVGQETVFLFARIFGDHDAALILACERDTNLGIMLTLARQLARGS